MPVDEAPEDDAVRQSYNFAPGYHGLVYRADVPDYGAGPRHDEPADGRKTDADFQSSYKLQAMKWGEPCCNGLGNANLFTTDMLVNKDWCLSGRSEIRTTAQL